MSTREDMSGIEENVMGAMSNMFANLRARAGQGGARPQARLPWGGGGGGMVSRVPAGGAPAPQLPGATASVNELRSFAGLGAAVWTGADAALKTLEIEPQESFQGRRLIFSEARTETATSSVVSIANLYVGSMPQSPVVDQSAPIAMFAPDATDAELDLQICYRGMKLVCQLSISAAPGSGETVTVIGGLYGTWLR